jgi:hypothetical protein
MRAVDCSLQQRRLFYFGFSSLDIHQCLPHRKFARQPVGEWILVDGETWIGPEGAGLATARLADCSGYFGRAVQSLVIEKR